MKCRWIKKDSLNTEDDLVTSHSAVEPQNISPAAAALFKMLCSTETELWRNHVMPNHQAKFICSVIFFFSPHHMQLGWCLLHYLQLHFLLPCRPASFPHCSVVPHVQEGMYDRGVLWHSLNLTTKIDLVAQSKDFWSFNSQTVNGEFMWKSQCSEMSGTAWQPALRSRVPALRHYTCQSYADCSAEAHTDALSSRIWQAPGVCCHVATLENLVNWVHVVFWNPA